ncbi:MAG: hypothetical protein H0X38_03710 [Planctomycetes bacterium]|nr:hypothetical protein [Planctomycetota bacterium]
MTVERISGRKAVILYGLSSLVGRASGLAVIPLMAFFMTIEEVGRWSQLGALRALVAGVATFSLDTYLTQHFHCEGAGGGTSLSWACVRRCLSWNALILLATAPFLVLWPSALLIVVVIWSGQANAVVNTWLAHLRISESSWSYCLNTLANGLLLILLPWILVAGCGAGVWGLALGLLIPWLVSLGRLLFVLPRGRVALPGLTAYLVRLFPARIATEMFAQTDRLLLAQLIPLREMGAYELANRCASALGLVYSSYKSVILPQALRELAAGRPAAAWAGPFATAWLKVQVAAGAGLMLAALAALIGPGRGRSGIIVFLPWAIINQSWSFASTGAAINCYHAHLDRVQQWMPFATIIMAVLGVLGGGALGGGLGAQIGYVAMTAASVIATRQVVWRLRPDLPTHPRLLVFVEAGSLAYGAVPFLPLPFVPWAGAMLALVAAAFAAWRWRR